MQLWQRDPSGPFRCVYRGGGPVESQVLGAWVRAAGESVEIADDRKFTRRWQTPIEAERARAEALASRVSELEAKLGRER